MQPRRRPHGAQEQNGVVLSPKWLAETYAPVVYRFCAMLCGDRAEAEDLAQEALLRAMRGAPPRGQLRAAPGRC
jgi:DNA-directed RNA polymerase specialized sigma24 family protein